VRILVQGVNDQGHGTSKPEENYTCLAHTCFLAGGGLRANQLRNVGWLQRRLQIKPSLLSVPETVGNWTDSRIHVGTWLRYLCFSDSCCNRSIIVIINVCGRLASKPSFCIQRLILVFAACICS